MERFKTFQYRLDLDEVQAELAARTAGCCRLVYNVGLEHRHTAYRVARASVGYAAQCGELPEVKQTDGFEFLAEVPSQCLQQSLKDLAGAFASFWKGRTKYPRFKRRGDGDSFRFPQPEQIHFDPARQGQMFLPKFGWVRFRHSRAKGADGQPVLPPERPYEGELCYVTVVRDGGHWYGNLTCRLDLDWAAPSGADIVGVDFGVVHTVTCSDGAQYHIPKLSDDEKAQMALLQTRINRKEKRSKNRKRAVAKLNRYVKRIVRRRVDAQHKATTELTKAKLAVFVERPRISNMTATARGTIEEPGTMVAQKAGLNAAILSQGWQRFMSMLDYKGDWYGAGILYVPAAYTSQRCSACGHTHKRNRVNRDLFECERCAHRDCADVNAATNVRDRGLAALNATFRFIEAFLAAGAAATACQRAATAA